MAETDKPNSSVERRPPKPLPSVPAGESSSSSSRTRWKGAQYPNPPEAVNPDATTLRDQRRFAIRQYSRWYSHAWGTAILAGVSFFALGWIIKGSNPLPSRSSDEHAGDRQPQASESAGER